ncbi:MAG TPA: PAS domain S-box protein [Desulfobulbaceae bacterium]|nr:PAS domain S-box protein [Desulfobulbaceae bacterium]
MASDNKHPHKHGTKAGRLLRALAPISSNNDQFRRHILWLLLIRVIFFTLLIGVTVVLGSLGTQVILPSDTVILAFLSILFIFSVGSSATVQKSDLHLKRFSLIQFLSDTVFAALLVYGTGCSQSIFTPVFIMPVIAGGLIMYRIGGFMSAAAATLLYGIVLFLEYMGIVPGYMTSAGYIPVHDLLKSTNLFAIYGVTFFITALLSGTLAARLRSTEEALTRTSFEFDRLSLLYKQIFDDIATGIITVDERGEITSYNAAAGRITGYPAKEVLGHPIEDFIPGLKLDHTFTRLVLDLKKKNGTMIRAGYSFSRLNLPAPPDVAEAGHDDCKVITLQDISAVEKMEKRVHEAEKMAAIGELSASIAHDFRNPLAAISGSAQLLAVEEAGKNGRGKTLSNIIFRESKRMAKTITEFLQFARPAPMQEEWFALKRVVDETITASDNLQAGYMDGTIRTEIQENLDVFGDRQQLQTVLSHLLENSLTFSQREDGPITISAHEEKKNNQNTLCLEVSDRGPGINPEIKQKIFQPFFSTRENGTGLGLAIVQQIIELHKGNIDVDTRPGKGCTFRIFLPLPSYDG